MEKQKIYLKANPKIVCREEDGDALLFNPETGLVKILNRTGYELWKLCDGTLAAEDIMAAMRKEYPDIAALVLRDDVAKCLQVMQESELILQTAL